jgi:hypothetical protein
MSADQSNLTAFDPEAVPANACVRFEVCQNTVPGNGQMCGDCLDELRAADREERNEQERGI